MHGSFLLVAENTKGKLIGWLLTFAMPTSFLTNDGLDLISSLFRKGDFVFTFDLKFGYRGTMHCKNKRVSLTQLRLPELH